MQFNQLFAFCKISCLDAGVWLATFLTVVIVDIDFGLVVGIVLSLICIFIRGMKPYTCLLGQVPKTNLFLDISRYKTVSFFFLNFIYSKNINNLNPIQAEELPNIKIFHYCGSINFASRNLFKSTLADAIQIDIAYETRKKMSCDKKLIKYVPPPFKSIIIDFSALSYIDASGALSLKILIKELNNLSVHVCLSGCSCPVYEMLKKCEVLSNQRDDFKVFPTVYDAVTYVEELIKPITVISVRL